MYRNVCNFPLGQCPIIWKPDYNVRYEFVSDTGFPPPNNEAIFGHVEVYRWNKSVRSEFLKDIASAYALLPDKPIFTPHDPLDRKHEKFIRMCGFEPAPPLACLYDGRWHQVWKHEPTRNTNNA
jgi:hypothetical protein